MIRLRAVVLIQMITASSAAAGLPQAAGEMRVTGLTREYPADLLVGVQAPKLARTSSSHAKRFSMLPS